MSIYESAPRQIFQGGTRNLGTDNVIICNDLLAVLGNNIDSVPSKSTVESLCELGISFDLLDIQESEPLWSDEHLPRAQQMASPIVKNCSGIVSR